MDWMKRGNARHIISLSVGLGCCAGVCWGREDNAGAMHGRWAYGESRTTLGLWLHPALALIEGLVARANTGVMILRSMNWMKNAGDIASISIGLGSWTGTHVVREGIVKAMHGSWEVGGSRTPLRSLSHPALALIQEVIVMDTVGQGWSKCGTQCSLLSMDWDGNGSCRATLETCFHAALA